MIKIVFEVPKSNNLAPLLEGNLRDGGFYPACMRLTRSGFVTFDVNYDDAQSFRVRRGVDHVWSFPPELMPKEIRRFAKEIRPLLRRVLKGLSIRVDEHDYEMYGHLNSAAEEAKAEIQSRCDDLFQAVRDRDLGVVSYDAAEFLAMDDLEDYGLSTTSSDTEIRKEAKYLERNLRREKIVLNADVYQSMRNWVEHERDR